MITVCRTRTLAALRADLASAEEAAAAARTETAGHRQEAADATATAARAQELAEELREQLATAAAEGARAAGELETLRAALADAETARREAQAAADLLETLQETARDAVLQVYVLRHYGEPHSLHLTPEAAQAAAEAEGAAPDRWTPSTGPDGRSRPACEVAWRWNRLPLQDAR